MIVKFIYYLQPSGLMLSSDFELLIFLISARERDCSRLSFKEVQVEETKNRSQRISGHGGKAKESKRKHLYA